MPSILENIHDPAKTLLIGKSGAGKSGSLASLVAAGYNLRIIDTDKGIRPLRSLLTDPRYPYAKVIAANNINLEEAVRYESIDTTMKLRTITTKMPNGNSKSETLLAPADAKAWPKVLTLLDGWKEGGVDLGPITSWTTNDVLVLDSFSTLAKCAYYFCQSMNARLGARDQGYDYQRDIGEAQSQLTRLLELLSTAAVTCNVIIISHITWVDDSAGVAQRPRVGDNVNAEIVMTQSDGYPSAIGRALSPQMGKYFNDCFVVRATGTGESVRRNISTVPQEGVIAKNSVFLDREYSVSSGMAFIFSALLSRPLTPEFLEAFTPAARRSAAPAGAKSEQRQPTAVSVAS